MLGVLYILVIAMAPLVGVRYVCMGYASNTGVFYALQVLRVDTYDTTAHSCRAIILGTIPRLWVISMSLISLCAVMPVTFVCVGLAFWILSLSLP